MKRQSKMILALLAATGAMLIGNTPLPGAEVDDRIEASAKSSYVFKTYLKDDAVKASSSEGVVTLTGTVAEPFHKSLAQDTVEGLPGVKSVDNQLKVKNAGPSENTDAWVTLKVKSALMFHQKVSATGTEVTTEKGVVTLRGEAASVAQKELTTEYAQDVEGVTLVKNEMTLAKTPAKADEKKSVLIDDASITAQIKAALMTHRSTSALKTKIVTVSGVVAVSGVAKNEAEKSLVTKLVSDIYGVSSVNNNMTVE